MRKLLIGLTLFTGASLAGTTYYSGAQTQPAYQRLLQQLNGNSLLAFESQDYDAGFMQSTALTNVKLKDDTESEILFTLKHDISHSPVSMVPESARFGAAKIVTTLSTDELEDEKLKGMLASFNTEKPFVLTTDVSMDGTTQSEFKINSFEHVDKNDPDKRINLSEGVINVLTTKDGDITGDGTLPNSLISIDSVHQGEASDTTMKFTMKKLDSSLGLDALGMMYDYNINFNMGQSKITNLVSEQVEVLISDSSFALQQTLSTDSPNASFTMNVANIVSDILPTKALYLKTSWADFSLDGIAENEAFFKKLQASDNPDPFDNEELALEFIKIARSTFPPDTNMAIVGRMETTDGDINADIKARFEGNGSADGYTGMVTIGDLARAFSASVDIDADRAALAGTPVAQMIENPFALMYLTITDETVGLNATLNQLELIVNKQTIPLELMAGEMLQQPLSAILEK